MKRVLLVGLDPATVDFSDPALPQGMNADKIHAGVKVALADMAERGWQAENGKTASSIPTRPPCPPWSAAWQDPPRDLCGHTSKATFKAHRSPCLRSATH